MSGAKKYKVNKPAEVFYRLSFGSEFNSSLRGFRKKFGIPVLGFNWVEEIDRWSVRNQDLFAYWRAKLDILRKFNIPPTDRACEILEDYILCNNKYTKLTKSLENIFITVSAEKQGKSFSLNVHSGASKNDLISYIEREWPRLKLLYKKPGFQRLKSLPLKKRDQILLGLEKLPRAELLRRSGKEKGSKYLLMSSIIKKEGSPTTPEAVKKTLQRNKKRL